MKGLAAGLGLCLAAVAIARVPDLAAAPWRFLALYAVAFVMYALGARWLAAARGGRALVLVLGVAAIARLALAPAAPTLSTDAYRYVWDARVAAAGISPYAYAPTAPEVAHLREAEIYPRLNHPAWHSIYPPGAQAFFRAVHAIAPDSVTAMKLAIGLGELAALGCLLGLLRATGLPLGRAVLYAWNPLVLVEIWGTGHLDGLVVAAVVAATWAWACGWPALAGALLGAGTLVKLYPAALLPLLVGRDGRRAVAAFAGVVVAGYAPVASLGLDALGSLPRYLAEEYFNPGLMRALTGSEAAGLAALTAWIAWAGTRRRDAPLWERAVPLIGGVVVLHPNIFPWYAVWLVPFLAVTPSWPWLGFTGTLAFAYTFFLGDWAVPAWARVAQFAPLAAGAAWALRGRWPALVGGARGAPG